MVDHSQERPSRDELLSELSEHMGKMVRQEVELAKTEMSHKVKDSVQDAVFILAGGFVIYGGFLALIAAAIFGLGRALPLWLSALLIGAAVILVGFLFVQKGVRGFKVRDFKPHKTLDTLKEGLRWAKEQI